MFESKTKTAELDLDLRQIPTSDLGLRDEIDTDPLIEEMTARLRAGLTSLEAVDEWGRPMTWRNVVRLAVGPVSQRLRDAEAARDLAVSMLPPAAEGQ